MKKTLKILLPIVLTLIFICSGAVTAFAEDSFWPADPALEGEAVFLLEANTDGVLYEKNAEQQMYPASTTKIMTCILALENCSLDETVSFSDNAVNGLEEGASTIGMQVGEEISMKDALCGLMIASANECAVAIAEHIAGSVEAFADMMNERAAEIGCTGTHFTNPHGLFDKEHYTTAHDLALIMQEAYKNSTFVEIISMTSYTIGPTNMDSEEKTFKTTVEMINPAKESYDEDVIGGKTGYLDESGRCLVVVAERNNMTLISVILNSDYYGIFTDTKNLLNYGFDNFAVKNISEEEQRFSYANADSPVALDASAAILTLNNLDFKNLNSTITYAKDMDAAALAEATENAGITGDDTRSIFASISYTYDGHYLGDVYVFNRTDMTFRKASFLNVYYVNLWLVLLGIIAVLILIIILSNASRSRKQRKRSQQVSYHPQRRRSGNNIRRY